MIKKSELKKNEILTPFINGRSKSLKMCRAYLNTIIEIEIDQPYGSIYNGITYEVNYGFIPNTLAPDGEPLDAYFLGPQKPLRRAKGRCIAIIHRHQDDDDKLIIVPDGEILSDEDIEQAVHFREKLFDHTIVRR